MNVQQKKCFYLFFLLLIICICVINFIRPKNYNKEELYPSKYSRIKAGEFNTFFLGDSRVFMGVSPNVFDRHTNGKTKSVILGGSGLQYNDAYYSYIDSLIEKRMVKNIVMGVTVKNFNQRAYPAKDTRFLPSSSHRPPFIFSMEKWFDVLKLDQIKKIIKRTQDKPDIVSERYTNGWFTVTVFNAANNKAMRNGSLSSYRKALEKYPFSFEKFNNFIVHTRIWASKGCALFAFRPPTFPDMVELENKFGYDEKYIREKLKEAGVIWLGTGSYEYSCFDGSHIDKPSAEKLSQFLGKQVGNCLKKQ